MKDEPHLMTTVLGTCLLGITLCFLVDMIVGAWRHAADQQLRAVQIQLDYDRELRSGQLERLNRPRNLSWEGSCVWPSR